MDLTFFTNGLSILALFIVCWCIEKIIQDIIVGISVTKSIKHMKNIPDEQRGAIIDNLFNKEMKDKVQK